MTARCRSVKAGTADMLPVSILMPVYNGEPYLREALDSVFAQNYANFELIVIDDGSTDGTPEVLDSVRDSRLRVYRCCENRGVAARLAEGLSLCSGEYVARLDADDIARPDRLEKQVTLLEEDPKRVIVAGGYQVVDELGRVLDRYCRPREHIEIEWSLLFENTVAHSAVMFRTTAALDVGGYDRHRVHVEDYDLWSRLLEVGKAVGANGVVVSLRQHQRRVSVTHAHAMAVAAAHVSARNLATLVGRPVAPEVAAYLRGQVGENAREELKREAWRLLDDAHDAMVVRYPGSRPRRTLTRGFLVRITAVVQRNGEGKSRGLLLGLRKLLRTSPSLVFSPSVWLFAMRMTVPDDLRARCRTLGCRR
jgi:glycosyltransferase involved in cell wall biosynthesis